MKLKETDDKARYLGFLYSSICISFLQGENTSRKKNSFFLPPNMSPASEVVGCEFQRHPNIYTHAQLRSMSSQLFETDLFPSNDSISGGTSVCITGSSMLPEPFTKFYVKNWIPRLTPALISLSRVPSEHREKVLLLRNWTCIEARSEIATVELISLSHFFRT